ARGEEEGQGEGRSFPAGLPHAPYLSAFALQEVYRDVSVVALATADDRGVAGDEGAHQERDEQQQGGGGGSLARLVSRFLRFLLFRLDLGERVVHALLCFLLGDAGPL